MCSESLPKEFEKTSEVIPLSTYGLSSVEEFRKAECDTHHLELLKRAGLSTEELKLYQENEAGLFCNHSKIESTILKKKLEALYNKIKNFQSRFGCLKTDDIGQTNFSENTSDSCQMKLLTIYPEGHPMNELRQLEENTFGHLKSDVLPITKRRKLLRRLERKKQRMLAEEKQSPIDIKVVPTVTKPGSLWDIMDVTSRARDSPMSSKSIPDYNTENKISTIIGPKKPTMYTIKDQKIVRLEPTDKECDEYKAVNIVIPVNPAEQQLLEGTKMPVDEIKKMDRFRDYEPGTPSKVLYLKNIQPSVSQQQLSLLFEQFLLDNGQPIDVRLMSGRMRGQAFVTFHDENLAKQALEEVNGTILSGRPIIVQFGKSSNHIQIHEKR